MSENHIRLYIPGPVEVSEKTFAAMCHPMIGHRSGDFAALYERIQPRLQELAGTTSPVYLSTSSAWGVMEAAIRNLVSKKVLNCCCGAFSDKWYDVALRCGKQAEALQVEWGEAIDPAAVDAKLATGEFDVITLVNNETSTGVLNPLDEIAAVVKKYPEVLFVVDTVSSFSAMHTAVDELGIDVLLAGSQKALAMPPGLTIFTASDTAMERASTMDDRGYYFDFLEFKKNQENHMTPSTPCISLIYALESKLDDIFTEGLENRFARHRTTNAMVHGWIEKNGFEHFAPEGYRSVTLTCAANNRDIDLGKWNGLLKSEHSLMINAGYGKIKGKTFRISNMGDETEETIASMLAALDDTLPKV
ncbi:MAG: aspartate aminotransferase-like enzyme [Pseudoalteromonas tetraodonis]|jgi:aspartate aminotransferase-like enzyme